MCTRISSVEALTIPPHQMTAAEAGIKPSTLGAWGKTRVQTNVVEKCPFHSALQPLVQQKNRRASWYSLRARNLTLRRTQWFPRSREKTSIVPRNVSRKGFSELAIKRSTPALSKKRRHDVLHSKKLKRVVVGNGEGDNAIATFTHTPTHTRCVRREAIRKVHTDDNKTKQ